MTFGLCAVLLLANYAHAQPVVLDDGGVHDLPPLTLVGTQRIDILDGPGGATTTLNLLDGGRAYEILPYENSVLNISGGLANLVQPRDNAVVNMTGGEVDSDIILTGDAQAHVSGGSLRNIQAKGNSVATYSGYAVMERYAGSDTSRGEISGGTILSGVTALDSAFILMSGGTVNGQLTASRGGVLHVTGGTWGDVVRTFDDSHITLFGDFNFAHGVYTIGSELDNALITGTLADGSSVSNIANFSGTGTITLAPVPEPGSVALLGLGGLCLLRRRR